MDECERLEQRLELTQDRLRDAYQQIEKMRRLLAMVAVSYDLEQPDKLQEAAREISHWFNPPN